MQFTDAEIADQKPKKAEQIVKHGLSKYKTVTSCPWHRVRVRVVPSVRFLCAAIAICPPETHDWDLYLRSHRLACLRAVVE